LRESVGEESTDVPSFQEFARRKLVRLGDRELIARVLTGEDTAFAVLMERYVPYVLGYLSGKTRRPADTEDIAQEVFLTAFRNLSKLRDPDRLGAWLVNVARSRLVDYYRAEGRRVKTVDPNASDESHGGGVWEVARDPALGPAERVSETQTRQVVLSEIARMGDAYRTVLYMRLVGEESTGVIAQRLGLTTATVRQRLLRGMRKLRRALKRHGLGLPLPGEVDRDDDRESEG
jgi:RNA polymerase sigma-70 factor (ECF subfamily)